MQYLERLPGNILAPYIKCFWQLKSNNTEVDTILPDGCMELIVHFGSSYKQLDNTPDDSQYRSFVFGQIEQAIKLQPLGVSHMLGVRFKPHGLSAFTPIPLNELTGRTVRLEDVWGCSGIELEEQLNELESLEERIKLLEYFFTSKLIVPAKTNALNFAVNFLKSAQVNDLSNSVNIGERQLQRLFLQHIGLSPKKLKRIYRLQNAISLINSGKVKSLTQVALESGYYDQAHFNRDFKSITYQNPKEYFNSEMGMGSLFIGVD